MKLDSVTVVPFPDAAAFGAMHEKFFELLVNSLNHAYSFADREDAVEEAFYKLMFKKDRDAYEKEPETESDWFYALRWQARADLSHRRERAGEVSGRELAMRYHTTSGNIYVIKCRVGRILRKHGPRCFERALKKEGYISSAFAA